MKHNSRLNLAKINPNSSRVNGVEIICSPEEIKSVLEELVGGSVGILKLDGGLFLLYNDSELTEKALEFNSGASWLVSKMTSGQQGEYIKVHGSVLVGGYTDTEPHTLISVDFEVLSKLFAAGEDVASPVEVSYGYKPSIN